MMPSGERHSRWGGGRLRSGRKTEETTEELSSVFISQKPPNWYICTWKGKNTEELFPYKVSSYSFHLTLYSSWLWWKGLEPNLLLKVAYSKQNGAMFNTGTVPGNHQAKQTTDYVFLKWSMASGPQGKDTTFGLFLGKMDCQIKESERKKWTSDLFLSCSPPWWALWKGLSSPHK